MKNILVTGGAGFIGSNFIHYLLENCDCKIVNLDALTYAGSLENLTDVKKSDRHTFVKGDINDASLVTELISKFEIDCIVNFAAESHVDRSILSPGIFISTNVAGTHSLLECARSCWSVSPNDKHCRIYKDGVRFIQVSTDEVYGSLGAAGSFKETSPIEPNSPYAASKASADLFARAYYETFGFPAIVTRCSNNFGPYQFPEKLIPLIIYNGLHDKTIPVYGDGLQIRNWLHVEDHCSAILSVMKSGEPGEVYNIGSESEESNLNVVCKILKLINKSENLIAFVQDRPGHDRRYSMDYTKLNAKTGWMPFYTFDAGLERTIRWYLDNEKWLENIANREFKDYYKLMYV